MNQYLEGTFPVCHIDVTKIHKCRCSKEQHPNIGVKRQYYLSAFLSESGPPNDMYPRRDRPYQTSRVEPSRKIHGGSWSDNMFRDLCRDTSTRMFGLYNFDLFSGSVPDLEGMIQNHSCPN